MDGFKIKNNKQLLRQLNWCYATKESDATEKSAPRIGPHDKLNWQRLCGAAVIQNGRKA